MAEIRKTNNSTGQDIGSLEHSQLTGRNVIQTTIENSLALYTKCESV